MTRAEIPLKVGQRNLPQNAALSRAAWSLGHTASMRLKGDLGEYLETTHAWWVAIDGGRLEILEALSTLSCSRPHLKPPLKDV